jgi:ubiquinol-cytochrome c reductase cytochrome c1 subunit
MIKKLLIGWALASAVAVSAWAAGTGPALDKAPDRLHDLPALQNGAKLFVNYCLNCHSAAYMRYNRLRDIGLTDTVIKENMLFATDKVGETMKAAIDPKQAKDWFGANPPDLTLITRSRSGPGGSGADYLYSYLRGYYVDPSKESGWNNRYFPSVGMPHVLWELQGKREAIFETVKHGSEEVHEFKGYRQLTPGTMTPVEYDSAVADLVGYMEWMGDPTQQARKRLGLYVLLFLAIMSYFTWRLNKAYWKDVK